VFDPSCDLLMEFVEAAAQRGVGRGKFWLYGCKSGTENAAVGSGAEPEGSQAGVGNAIAVGLRDAFDDAMQTEAAEVIGHLPLRKGLGWLPEQRCEVWAEIAVGKAYGKELE
jgi:hypothetical protein